MGGDGARARNEHPQPPAAFLPMGPKQREGIAVPPGGEGGERGLVSHVGEPATPAPDVHARRPAA